MNATGVLCSSEDGGLSSARLLYTPGWRAGCALWFARVAPAHQVPRTNSRGRPQIGAAHTNAGARALSLSLQLYTRCTAPSAKPRRRTDGHQLSAHSIGARARGVRWRNGRCGRTASRAARTPLDECGWGRVNNSVLRTLRLSECGRCGGLRERPMSPRVCGAAHLGDGRPVWWHIPHCEAHRKGLSGYGKSDTPDAPAPRNAAVHSVCFAALSHEFGVSSAIPLHRFPEMNAPACRGGGTTAIATEYRGARVTHEASDAVR